MVRMVQAVAHMVEHGGACTVDHLCGQWSYLTRKGTVKLISSRRHGSIEIPFGEIPEWTESWFKQTGHYQDGQPAADGNRELSTHFVVPLPRGVPVEAARELGEEWAWEMFGSGRHGAEWDYVIAFHTDRPHPHSHVIINRTSFPDEETGHVIELKISHRNEDINWDSIRQVLVEVANRLDFARRYDIQLEASSREQRGIPGPSLTTGQYRQRIRNGTAANGFLDDVEQPEFGSLSAGLSPNPEGGQQVQEGSPNHEMRGVSLHAADTDVTRDPPQLASADQQSVAGPSDQGGSEGGAAGVSPNAGRAEGSPQFEMDDAAQPTGNPAAAERLRLAAVYQQNAAARSVQRRSNEADQQRTKQIAEERADREQAEWRRQPDRHRSPSGPIDQKRRRKAEWQRDGQIDDVRETRQASDRHSGPNRRRTPAGVVEGIAEEAVRLTKGQQVRQAMGVRQMETRAMRRARTDPTAANPRRGAPSNHPMELRGTTTPQDHQARKHQSGAAGGSSQGNDVDVEAPNPRRGAPSVHPMELRGTTELQPPQARKHQSGAAGGSSQGSDMDVEAPNPKRGAPSVHSMELRGTTTPQEPQAGKHQSGAAGSSQGNDVAGPSTKRTKDGRKRDHKPTR